MKKTALLLTFLICNLIAFAKVKDIRSLGKADICVVFKRTMVLDTITPDEYFRIDNLTLMAGKDGSAFYSEDRKKDLEMSENNKEYFLQKYSDPKIFGKIAMFEKEAIFRDYKQNVCIVHQSYDITSWELTEEIEKPEWEIGDSIINILGYECIKATTVFRGRTWTAFFSPEIPIPDGPWKLCGLPGMILKAYDKKNEYCYEAIALNTKELGDVEFYNYYDRLKIKDRKQGLRDRKKSMSQDMRSKVNAITGLNLDVTSAKKPTKQKRYDFEETDY